MVQYQKSVGVIIIYYGAQNDTFATS